MCFQEQERNRSSLVPSSTAGSQQRSSPARSPALAPDEREITKVPRLEHMQVKLIVCLFCKEEFSVTI